MRAFLRLSCWVKVTQGCLWDTKVQEPHSTCTPRCRTCVSAHVCVSKMQERVNTAKSLNGSWEFVFLWDLHWEETPTLFVLVRSWISLLKRQWNFSRRQSAAGATMAGAAASGETQKPAQAGLGARVSGGHGLCQVAIEGLQSGAMTRTEEAFSRQSGSGSECGANSIHPLHLSPLPPPEPT